MSASIPNLLEILFEAERSVGVDSNAIVRRKIQEAEDCALQMQKEIAEKLGGPRVQVYRAA
jgi:hypothetical protein